MPNALPSLLTPIRGGFPLATGDGSGVLPLSSLFCYLIVLPLDMIEPCFNPKSLPDLLKRSGTYLKQEAWSETLKVALCPKTRMSYSDALVGAQSLMYKYGSPATDMQEVYRVIDWLQDIHGAVMQTYQRLDNRPFEEILFERVVLKDALYLKVIPAIQSSGGSP
jgi:hypothetical protein